MWIGILALFISGIFGGLSPILLKIGIKEFPPIMLTAIRFIVATIIFYPFFARQKANLSAKDILRLSKNSVFFALNVGIFSIAIQFTTAIVSQILYTLVPIIVIVLSFFMLKEKLTKNRVIGLIIAVAGVGFLISGSLEKGQVLTFGTPFGNILVLGAVLTWAFYLVLSKKLTNQYSPTTTSFASFCLTAIILSLLAPFEYIVRPLEINRITLSGIGSILALGIFNSALMFFLIQIAIKRTTAFTASFFQYLGPFVAAVVAIPVLGEKPTWTLFAGGLLIILGVFYATTYEYLKKYLRIVLK